MLEALIIEPTEETPKINFNPEKNIFEISGLSMAENVDIVYNPLNEWINRYIKNPNNITKFCFKLKYFNTASSKALLLTLLSIEKIKEKNKKVEIIWYYQTDDEDMKEAGEEFKELVDIPFQIIPY